jgi:hypothetical protein
VNLFDSSTLNSSYDQITQLSKTATVLDDEVVTNNNITSYITQNVNISSSLVIDSRTNIFLGRNRNIWLINLSASLERIDWVYGDNVTSVNIRNSTLPLSGVITSLLNSTNSNLTIIEDSILGNTYLTSGNCKFNRTEIVFIGSLTIDYGEILTVGESNISFQSSFDGEFYTEILNGGEINIENNSKLAPYSNSYNYSLWVQPGGTFRMTNSHLEGCGYSLPNSDSGLWVNASKEFVFINNTLITSYFGLCLDNISEAIISGNIIMGGKTGIYINNSNGIIIESNVVQDIIEEKRNLGTGIILNSSYNCTVSNNFLTNITGGMDGIAGVQNDGEPGGPGAGISLYDAFNNTLYSNVLSNITGGLAESGGIHGDGGTGGIGTGIYVINSSYNDLYWNTIINITGGTGGLGDHKGSGGIGGLGF